MSPTSNVETLNDRQFAIVCSEKQARVKHSAFIELLEKQARVEQSSISKAVEIYRELLNLEVIEVSGILLLALMSD